jgi:hypothetical protein
LPRWSASSPPISAPAIDWSRSRPRSLWRGCVMEVWFCSMFDLKTNTAVALPGAMNIPLRQLEQRLTELPRKQEIVDYCRRPYCVLSFEAVPALRSHGFTVRRFEDGFPEWKAAGLPNEAAPKGRIFRSTK